jgi:hypothetical protein
VRYTVIEKICLCWPRWRQAPHLLGRVVDTAPSPSEFVAGDCFGRLAENKRLALEGLVAGERLSPPAAASQPSDEDPAQSAG